MLLTAILLYILCQLIIGWWVGRNIQNQSDYVLAGRSLGRILGTFTVFATWFGAETCIGAASTVHKNGIFATLSDPFGFALGILLGGLFLARTLYRRGLFTFADLFVQRYGVIVGRIVAVLIAMSALTWAGGQLRAFGQILATLGNFPIAESMIAATFVVIIYTSVGGLLADVWSDLIQGSVLILGLVSLFVLIFLKKPELLTDLPAVLQHNLHKTEFAWGKTAEIFAAAVLGTMVSQELIGRFLAMKSGNVARDSGVYGASLYLIVGLIPLVLGLVAGRFLGEAYVDSGEGVLLDLARHELSPVLFVIFVGALVSAILSTVDTTLLVCGSTLAHNLVEPLFPNQRESDKLLNNRFLVIGSGVLALLIGLSSESVYALAELSSGLGSAGLVVLLVFALLPAKYHHLGGEKTALFTLLVGLSVYLAGELHEQWLPYPYLSALALAFITYFLGIICQKIFEKIRA